MSTDPRPDDLWDITALLYEDLIRSDLVARLRNKTYDFYQYIRMVGSLDPAVVCTVFGVVTHG